MNHIDIHGNERKLGCIPREPKIKVGSAFEDNFDVWDDKTIAEVIATRKSRQEYLKSIGFWDIFTTKANQFNSNGCNGWLTANAYTLARVLGGNKEFVVFSGAYNYSLMNGGVDQGSVLEDGYRTASQHGFVPVEQCPWNMIYRAETRRFDVVAALNRAADPYPARTLQGFKTGLARGAIGGAAIEVGNRLERPGANGIAGIDRGPGNHAVATIDIQQLPDGRFKFPTYLDWGASHGHEGVIDLIEDHYADTFGNHMFWLMPVGQWGG